MLRCLDDKYYLKLSAWYEWEKVHTYAINTKSKQHKSEIIRAMQKICTFKTTYKNVS